MKRLFQIVSSFDFENHSRNYQLHDIWLTLRRMDNQRLIHMIIVFLVHISLAEFNTTTKNYVIISIL